MIIYKTNKAGFLEDIYSGELTEKLENEIKFRLNRSTSQGEMRSWDNSLKDMALVLNDKEIDDNIGVALEYNLPRTSKRIDFIITGISENKRNLIIIELKQWEKCEKVQEQDMIVRTFLSKSYRDTTHPSYQAHSYGVFLKDYSEVVYSNNDIGINTCAFLHNYDIDNYPDIIADEYQEYIEKAPLFFKKDKKKLKEYIKQLICMGDEGQLITDIDEGQIRPGKSLQEFVKNIIDGDEIFTLLDDQKIVFEKILSYIRKSKNDKKKRVLILPGGPGTGKTVIALRLLSKCLQYDMNSLYISKNKNLRNIYEKKIIDNNGDKKYTKARIANLFKGSGSFISLRKNEYDASIVDEAHRLISKSQYVKEGQGYNNQIREIICESLISVFFVDERQIVTTEDIGTIETIKRAAYEEGIDVKLIKELPELKTQFRTSGADKYIDFVNHIIYGDELPIDISFLHNYDFRIFDDAQEMFDAVKAKNTNNNARCVAGYCWNWESKNNPNVNDIIIGDFQKKWNLSTDNYWMVNPSSIDQIGCIHTCQGLEIEYCGVIIGNDIFYDNDIKTNLFARAKTDKSLKGLKKMHKINKEYGEEIADKIIKNTYKVLLTRGIKGTYVYCENKKLATFLKKKIKN